MAIMKLDGNCADLASKLLTEGKNVILPSDTVYGILANAYSEKSVEGIYNVKKRRKNNPIGIFVLKEDIGKFAYLNEYAEKIIDIFPAPVGIILKKKRNIPDFLTSGLDTIMIMCHESKLIEDILRNTGVPIAASSVNVSGHDAAIAFEEVIQFKDNVDLLIDGGIVKYQVNGTILDLTDKPIIRRIGSYPVEKIKQMIPDVIVCE